LSGKTNARGFKIIGTEKVAPKKKKSVEPDEKQITDAFAVTTDCNMYLMNKTWNPESGKGGIDMVCFERNWISQGKPGVFAFTIPISAIPRLREGLDFLESAYEKRNKI